MTAALESVTAIADFDKIKNKMWKIAAIFMHGRRRTIIKLCSPHEDVRLWRLSLANGARVDRRR